MQAHVVEQWCAGGDTRDCVSSQRGGIRLVANVELYTKSVRERLSDYGFMSSEHVSASVFYGIWGYLLSNKKIRDEEKSRYIHQFFSWAAFLY
jgi:hypothetical protein